MGIHLLRTAVGSKDLDELQAFQAHFRTRIEKGSGPVVIVTTRHMPKRAEELLDNGSLYWIVKNSIQARQAIVDVALVKDSDGESSCQISLDPQIIRVAPMPQPAVQGWRYLEPARAPKDIGPYRSHGENQGPEDMARELKALGLL